MTPQLPEGYSVEFVYDLAFFTRTGRAVPDGPHRMTVARIYDKKDDVMVASDFAICGPRDNFSKRVGRAIALGRALKLLDNESPT